MLSASAGAERSRALQQLSSRSCSPRDYADKYDAKIDDQINDKMTAFLRFSQRKDNQFYQPRSSGPSGGRRQRLCAHARSERGVRVHLDRHAVSLLDARLGFSHILGGKLPPFLGGASMQSRTDSRASHVRRFSPAD